MNSTGPNFFVRAPDQLSTPADSLALQMTLYAITIPKTRFSHPTKKRKAEMSKLRSSGPQSGPFLAPLSSSSSVIFSYDGENERLRMEENLQVRVKKSPLMREEITSRNSSSQPQRPQLHKFQNRRPRIVRFLNSIRNLNRWRGALRFQRQWSKHIRATRFMRIQHRYPQRPSQVIPFWLRPRSL